jgi:hypothetical protein
MLGESYPFVIIGLFVVAMAILAYVSRGGAAVFIGAIALFLFCAVFTFMPLVVRALPHNGQTVVTVLCFLVVSGVIVYEIYRKFTGNGGRDSENDDAK